MQFFSEWSEGLGEFGNIGTTIFDCPLNTHEEEAEFVILMLVGVQDVGSLFVEKASDARYQALSVGTVDQENCAVVAGRRDCFWHRSQLNRPRWVHLSRRVAA